jgi:hypothetical protein
MAYLAIDNFAAGLDTRKSALTSAPGTLQRLVNAMVTPGGEIAKRRAFVKIATLTGTFGLAATESAVYAFTRNVVSTPPVIAVPSVTLIYQKIPNAATDLVQTDFDVYDGKIYLACDQPSGATAAGKNPHYYDGVLTEGAGKGRYVRSYRSKMYAVEQRNLFFSAIDNPMIWDAGAGGTGQGFINLSAQDADSERLTSLEVYYDKLGVFSSEATQLWGVDPDPAQNALSQILRQSGTLAPLSTQQYGSGDVLFLAQSGVRSVRARDSSNAAAVSDIGSPIDSLMQELYVTRGEAYFSKGRALLEPIVGRFWMTFEDEFYALSAFPGPKITAWSYHRFSALGVPFKAAYVVTCGGRVFIRDDANNLYVYGGNDGNQFDNCGVEVRLPFLDMGKPGTNKVFTGIDLTVTGTWTVKNTFDYNNPDTNEETLGTFSAPTWRDGKAAFEGQSTHFSLRLYNNDSSPALLSNAAIHYALAGEES